MPSLRPVPKPPPATPDNYFIRWMKQRWWLIAGITLVLAASAGFMMKLRHDWRERDDIALKALAALPGALADVPLPQGRETPAARLHKACALLAKDFKIPAGKLEADMRELAIKMAREDANSNNKTPEPGRTGAQLMRLYILSNAESPVTLKEREKLALSLGLGQDVYGLDRGDRGAVLNREGEAELRAVLAARRAVQGVSHADTLNTWLMVVTNLYRQKQDAEAEAECRQLLSYYQRTAKLSMERAPYELMADIFRETGKCIEEESFRRWLLSESARQHGEDSISASEDHFDLALCLKAVGN
ncbi:MAG TPA: hypothetical protein VG796_19815, partial [Verrucomicrobiales bacterium]|nr:hypothetical protein [Verrucomicrobiales bacterium]